VAGKSKYLIVVSGPTASGKTGLSIALAKEFQTEIVCADARQIYRHMDIGTAKPTPSELEAAPHHLVDFLDIEESYSAGQYERDALEVIEKIHNSKEVAIMVGGSGFYVQALTDGIPETPESVKTIRDELNLLFDEKGLSALQERLVALNAAYYETCEQQNPRRLMRAIEIIESTGKLPTEFEPIKKDRPFKCIFIGLDWEREALYDRINRRVDLMVEAGLEAEAKSLSPKRKLQSTQTVGYCEWFDFFDGNISREKAIELIKRNSRHYAKRQMTWWRKKEEMHWFKPDDLEGILNYLRKEISTT